MTQGTYNYDDTTLFLTPDSSDDPSQFEYEFTSDDVLELKARVSTIRTRVVVYHRHSVAHRCLLTRTHWARALPRMGT